MREIEVLAATPRQALRPRDQVRRAQ